MLIAVASPFVDRRHGTERALAEALERMAANRECGIHLYSERVEQLTFVNSAEASPHPQGKIVWHHVAPIRGPHLARFLWWYRRNTAIRVLDRRNGLNIDVVFSPGINCPDADVILVHAVFHRLAELERETPRANLRGLHQKLYYRTLCAFERKLYQNPRTVLAAVSRHTADQLAHYFGRSDVEVVPNGVDSNYFSPAHIAAIRAQERHRRQVAAGQTVLLLVGNDWRNKGLPTLLEAAALCRELPIQLLIVGAENAGPFLALAKKLGIASRISFACPEPDVRSFYAVSDILVAPSLEDSFNLPALEAMSCGLPVVASTSAGISEWIRDGENGLLLQTPREPPELAACIRRLVSDPGLVKQLGENARRTAAELSWDRHAEALLRIIRERAKTH